MMSEHREEGVKVPNEVLMQILYRVPTSDLLETCRLVSSQWSHVANLVCRQRQVKFDSGANFEYLHVCAATFKHPETVPWSAISLSTSSRLLAAHSGQVAEIFGPKITLLQLTFSRKVWADHFQTALKILSLTPNLRRLEIFKISDHKFCALVPKLLETRLQELSAEVTYTGRILDWTLLGNQRQFTLENLTLISIGPIRRVNYFRPLERFLGSCSGGLKSLKIVGFLSQEETEFQKSLLLKIPAMPNLKSIEFLVRTRENHADTTRKRCLHFEKLRAAQFPALETVQFQMETAWEGGGLGDLRLTVSEVFGHLDGGPFATVTTLSLGDQIVGDQMERDPIREYAEWALRFPNTTRLAATLSSERDIQGIVALLSKLEVLRLTIKKYKDTINVAMTQIVQFLPSLSALKRLIIKNAQDATDPLSDTGAIVLTLLHPLHLTIINAQLSDNCVALLRQRHLHFDLI